MESIKSIFAKTKNILNSRKGRQMREYGTAYLMLAPALTLIFIFGLFPVAFALYVSVHKWRILQGDLLGVVNYSNALDDFAYIGFFAIGLGALFGAYKLFQRYMREIKELKGNQWPLLVPALLHAATVIAFLRWLFYLLPEFLNIATKMRGLERTRELFIRLLSEAFFAESVYPHWQQFVLILLVAIVSGILASLYWKAEQNSSYQLTFTIFWLAIGVGFGVINSVVLAINDVYAAALVSGEDPGIWPQLIVVGSGFILLGIAWKIWRSAEQIDNGWQFVIRILGAIVLLVGAVILIIEIPTIVASGDKDLWNGLKVTVFFSLGTVPVQLTIALFLSVLLFQGIKGSDIFRMIFFLPYVTPAVASATVFRLMFSDRASSPANSILGRLGIDPQLWLREADGILNMLGEAVGVEGFPGSVLPAWLPADLSTLLADWLAGPSLALMVIIMLSVWTFVGYNVVIYMAGLANIPTELTEAAEIDGASRWDVFRHITFPLLSPTTYFLSLIAVMGTFKAFNTIWVMRARTGSAMGSVDTFSVMIFQEFFTKSRYGYASAMAFVLFAIILGLTIVNNRIQGSRVFYG